MSPAVLPALSLALFLLASGLLKLGPGGSAAASRFVEALELRWLPNLRPVVLVRTVAGIEVALGVGLFLADGAAAVVVAAGAVLLLAAMTGLVMAALRRGVQTGCGCLGEAGPPIDSRTAVRNVVLTGLGFAALAAALAGQTPRGSLEAGHALALVWAVAVAAVGWTLVPRTGSPGSPVSAPAEAAETLTDPEDFIRTPIPAVALWEGPSALPLHRLIESGPRLLVLATSDDLLAADGAELLARRPGLEAVRPSLVAVGDAGGGAGRLRDPAWVVVQSLAVTELPAAVLLGADGWIAGGPVYRWPAILELAEEIEEALTTGSACSP